MKISVGVFFGGKSCEHEISCISGNQVLHAINKDKYDVIPVYVAKNLDLYTGEELYDLSNYYSLEELQNSWMSKENTPCIFISAKNKIKIDKLRNDLYKMVAEIHAGRYPFDNFLW